MNLHYQRSYMSCRGCLLHSSTRQSHLPHTQLVLHASVRAYHALQLARETTIQQRSYTLPDGRTIRLASERFMAPEALFNPSLLDMEAPGIAEQVFQCIQVQWVLPTCPRAVCCSVVLSEALRKGLCLVLPMGCQQYLCSKHLRLCVPRIWMWTTGCLFTSTLS